MNNLALDVIEALDERTAKIIDLHRLWRLC